MPSERRRWRAANDGGMVTAELAACLPVLVLLLAVVLSAVSVASARVRAQDAAREVARATARGGTAPAADDRDGVSVRVTTNGAQVVATATRRVHLLVPFLAPVTVTERAVAAREPP